MNYRSSLLGMFGVRFSFVATRSGFTRVRHFDATNDSIKKEALAFAKKHSRTVDETFYSRTVDYNMLINPNATLIQVPFNTHEKIANKLKDYDNITEMNFQTSPLDTLRLSEDMSLIEKLEILKSSSLYVIATQSIIVKEGERIAVAGVSGIFYDYASFVMRFLNSTNNRYLDSAKPKHASCFTDSPEDELCDDAKISVKCGQSNDTIDCLLVDNNGYIVISERLEFIGRHLKSYDPLILQRLVSNGVFHEVNITDHQAICVRYEEKQQASSALSRVTKLYFSSIFAIVRNILTAITYIWTTITAVTLSYSSIYASLTTAQPLNMNSALPNKTYLQPCEKIQTLYETRADEAKRSGKVEYFNNGNNWFVYEKVPNTNLIMILVDKLVEANTLEYDDSTYDPIDPTDAKLLTNSSNEDNVCSYLERETKLYKKKLDSCVVKHPDEEHIKICGRATKSSTMSNFVLVSLLIISLLIYL